MENPNIVLTEETVIDYNPEPEDSEIKDKVQPDLVQPVLDFHLSGPSLADLRQPINIDEVHPSKGSKPIWLTVEILESYTEKQKEMEAKKQETENQIRILSQALSLLSVEMYSNKQIIDLLTKHL